MGSDAPAYVDPQKIAIVGIILGIALSLSPIPTFVDIAVHSKTTGGYTAAPYIASLMCCSMWLTYAIMAGAAKFSMIPLNAVSFVVYFIYCGIYLYFSPDRFRTTKLYMGALAIVAVAVTIGIVTKSVIFVGIVATVTNCLMFAAPLMVMQLVIKTRSVRYMPLLLSLSGFLCACTWLLWAAVVSDYFVLIPNALGAFFGLIQIILYTVYWIIGRNDSRIEMSESLASAREIANEDLTPIKQPSSTPESPKHTHKE